MRWVLIVVAIVLMYLMFFLAMGLLESAIGKLLWCGSIGIVFVLVGLASRRDRPNTWQEYVHYQGMGLFYYRDGRRHPMAAFLLCAIYFTICVAIWLA